MKCTKTWHRLVAVIISVILLSLGWLGLSGLGLLVALIPLLIISESYSDSRRDWWRMCGWAALTFLAWSLSTIWWVWNAAPIGVIVASIVPPLSSIIRQALYVPAISTGTIYKRAAGIA